MRYNISASIVLYRNSPEILKKAIDSFLQTPVNTKLFLVDNSPTDELKEIAVDFRVEYFHNPSNPGYGAGHNLAIKKILGQSEYHLVLNPDISFLKGTLENLYTYMQANRDVGQVMPKVYYEDGKIQRLCKLLPDPLDLFGRRFLKRTSWAKRRNQRYELHNFDYNSILNTPCLSGCFMFLRTSVLEKIGLFDERFFMYLEDFDLTRRIHKISKTIFYPNVSIIHGYQNESYKNKKLFKVHVESTIKYFNKWGWFCDQERFDLNRKVLKQIESKK